MLGETTIDSVACSAAEDIIRRRPRIFTRVTTPIILVLGIALGYGCGSDDKNNPDAGHDASGDVDTDSDTDIDTDTDSDTDTDTDFLQIDYLDSFAGIVGEVVTFIGGVSGEPDNVDIRLGYDIPSEIPDEASNTVICSYDGTEDQWKADHAYAFSGFYEIIMTAVKGSGPNQLEDGEVAEGIILSPGTDGLADTLPDLCEDMGAMSSADYTTWMILKDYFTSAGVGDEARIDIETYLLSGKDIQYGHAMDHTSGDGGQVVFEFLNAEQTDDAGYVHGVAADSLLYESITIPDQADIDAILGLLQ